MEGRQHVKGDQGWFNKLVVEVYLDTLSDVQGGEIDTGKRYPWKNHKSEVKDYFTSGC